MANIEITLLTSKRTFVNVDGLGSVVAAQAGGYVAVAGEHNSTTIAVQYPNTYAGQAAWVHMRNSAGEYKTIKFDALHDPAKVEFALPGEMTLEGNTYLVFYAVSGSGDDEVKTVWAPVVVPIASTGVDYKKVAMASPDVLEKVMTESAEAIRIAREIEQKQTAGELDGKSVWVRFSASEDGANMTEEWTIGQNYIGAYLGQTASETPSDYQWMRFVGGSYCADDDTGTVVDYTAVDNTDKSFTASGITSAKITIPATASHGYHAGVNIKSGQTPPAMEFVNNAAGKTLRVLQYGFTYDSPENYHPSANVMIQMAIYCDGANVCISIVEVPV